MISLRSRIPSSTKIREELERMVVKDLLGPVGGPEEKIDEQSVRDRCLFGMLSGSASNSHPLPATHHPPRTTTTGAWSGG